MLSRLVTRLRGLAFACEDTRTAYIPCPRIALIHSPNRRCTVQSRLFVLILLLALIAGCGTEEADPIGEEAAAITERLASSEGGALVLRAIDAAGGIRAWLEAPTSSYTWEYGGDAWLMKTHLVADNRSRRIYHDILATGSRLEPVESDATMAWDGEKAWVHPDTSNVNPRFWAPLAYYFQSIPFVLADPGLRYTVLEDDSLDGTAHQMVRVGFDDGVGDSPGDTYTLYVHPESGRVGAIRYSVTYGRGRPEPGEPVSETLMYFLDYETVDGLTVPTRFESYAFDGTTKGDLRGTASASDISFRAPFDEARLVMPDGGRVQGL